MPQRISQATREQVIDLARRNRTREQIATQLNITTYAVWKVLSEAGMTRTRNGAVNTGRAFGVELELTGPSSSTILNALTAAGIRVRNVGTYRASNGNAAWELKHDGSVAGHGLELVSPKLRGAAGFEQLRKVCEALTSVGATVNRTCGLHVHHDMNGLNADQIKRQVLMFVERQHLIDQLVAPSRRASRNHYCGAWSANQTQQLRDFSIAYGRTLRDIAFLGPRGTINLQAYTRHGTVEIRQHGGSTNGKKIAAWVRFGQALFAAAESGRNVSTTDVRQMLTDLGMSDEDKQQLLRFVAAAEAAAERVETDEYAGV
jgi:hypothetical protein